VSRDRAIPPTRPEAPEPELTEEQIRRAIRYNAFRFKDPYSIAVVRDIVGVSRFPAVSDEDLARGVARYQASMGLTPDGQAGPGTTGRLVAEARAEDLPRDADQLRADNFVTWAPAAGVHNGCGAAADAAGRATFFQWDVNFSTSLRNGWIVQEIVNARNRTTCAGGAIAETLTPHYWEAWWVDGAGTIRVPTAINAGYHQCCSGARRRSLAPRCRRTEPGQLEHERSAVHVPAPPGWLCGRQCARRAGSPCDRGRAECRCSRPGRGTAPCHRPMELLRSSGNPFPQPRMS
jgi:hypothetical protein